MPIPPHRLRPPVLRLMLGVVMLCACGAVAAAAAASGTTRAAASARRSLVLIRRNPAVVRGSGFRSHRRVSVTLVAGRSYVQRPLANRFGTFTATFPTAVDRCTTWVVTAVQRDAAPVVVRGPKPECAPASTP